MQSTDFNALFPPDTPVKFCRVSFTTAAGVALATVVPFSVSTTAAHIIVDVCTNFAVKNGLNQLNPKKCCLAFRYIADDGQQYLESLDDQICVVEHPFVQHVLKQRAELLFFLLPKRGEAVRLEQQLNTLGAGGDDVESPERRRPLESAHPPGGGSEEQPARGRHAAASPQLTPNRHIPRQQQSAPSHHHSSPDTSRHSHPHKQPAMSHPMMVRDKATASVRSRLPGLQTLSNSTPPSALQQQREHHVAGGVSSGVVPREGGGGPVSVSPGAFSRQGRRRRSPSAQQQLGGSAVSPTAFATGSRTSPQERRNRSEEHRAGSAQQISEPSASSVPAAPPSVLHPPPPVVVDVSSAMTQTLPDTSTPLEEVLRIESRQQREFLELMKKRGDRHRSKRKKKQQTLSGILASATIDRTSRTGDVSDRAVVPSSVEHLAASTHQRSSVAGAAAAHATTTKEEVDDVLRRLPAVHLTPDRLRRVDPLENSNENPNGVDDYTTTCTDPLTSAAPNTRGSGAKRDALFAGFVETQGEQSLQSSKEGDDPADETSLVASDTMSSQSESLLSESGYQEVEEVAEEDEVDHLATVVPDAAVVPSDDVGIEVGDSAFEFNERKVADDEDEGFVTASPTPTASTASDDDGCPLVGSCHQQHTPTQEAPSDAAGSAQPPPSDSGSSDGEANAVTQCIANCESSSSRGYTQSGMVNIHCRAPVSLTVKEEVAHGTVGCGGEGDPMDGTKNPIHTTWTTDTLCREDDAGREEVSHLSPDANDVESFIRIHESDFLSNVNDSLLEELCGGTKQRDQNHSVVPAITEGRLEDPEKGQGATDDEDEALFVVVHPLLPSHVVQRSKIL